MDKNRPKNTLCMYGFGSSQSWHKAAMISKGHFCHRRASADLSCTQDDKKSQFSKEGKVLTKNLTLPVLSLFEFYRLF
jgi:hypothetical protein